MTALPWANHLIIVPVLLPLVVGAAMIPINQKHHGLKFALGLTSGVLLWAAAVALLLLADSGHWPGGIGVYLAANWAAPFGIALVADRLSALMLVLTATIALAVLVFSARRWDRVGVSFHSLFQFLLMGLNGAFLTNDLFNLFVFFEVMLAASYGLVLHGYNLRRIQAGMQYIAVNLVASLLFLIGVSLIYAASGTLNIADLGARVALLGAQDAWLLQIGAVVLALAFLTKGAMWPLGFWLPTTYASASAPVGAMLVLMTKVGVYAVLRVWLAVFGEGAGAAEGFGFTALALGGMATLLFGAIGMLASQDGGRMAGYGAIVSSGTLLAVVGHSGGAVLASGLYYLLGSTLAMAAFMLLIELTERIRPPGAALLAITMEAFAIEDKPEDPVGVGIPGTLAFLGLSFAACALVIAGMPPLSGFVAKFSLFHALLAAAPEGAPATTWMLIGLMILGGLAAIIALMRLGVRIFWAAAAVLRGGAGGRAGAAVRAADGAGGRGVRLPRAYHRGPAAQRRLRCARARRAPRAARAGRGGGCAMRRWLPSPLLSASLLLMWLMLNQTLEPAHWLLGGVLGVLAPLLSRPLQPHGHARIRRPLALFRLLWMAAIEIVRSCFNVTQIILLRRSADVNSQFIRVPLDLKSPHGLALLSCLINSTPGTVWVEIVPDSHELLLHVFDLHDEAWWVHTIKTRYEQPIIEVFETPEPGGSRT